MKKVLVLLGIFCLAGFLYSYIEIGNPVSFFSGFGAPSELTISSGVITRLGNYHTVDTEGDASTDDLDTINGGDVGKIIILTTVDDARDIVVKHGTGNLRLSQSNDFTLDNVNATIQLIYNGTNWLEQTRSANQ